MKVKSDLNINSFKEEKSLSEFIHRIGHDIGNPLTSLISLASLLERSASNPKFVINEADTTKYIKSIISDAWRVQALVEKTTLLLSARSSHEEAPVNIGEVLQQSINKILRKPLFQRFDIAYTPPQEPLMAKISRSSLEWVCNELITNALNHLSLSEEGHEFPVIVSVSKADGTIILEIQNDFVVEKNFDLKTLFDPFVKYPESSKGGGLGLTAACHVLSKAKSELSIELDEEKKRFKAVVQLPSA